MSNRLNIGLVTGDDSVEIKHGRWMYAPPRHPYRLRFVHRVLGNRDDMYLSREQLVTLHAAITEELARSRAEPEAQGYLHRKGR